MKDAEIIADMERQRDRYRELAQERHGDPHYIRLAEMLDGSLEVARERWGIMNYDRLGRGETPQMAQVVEEGFVEAYLRYRGYADKTTADAQEALRVLNLSRKQMGVLHG